MAQLIVRNLDNDVRDGLRALAVAHGRSMEEEVREILRAAVLQATIEGSDQLGTRLAARFGKHGLDHEIPEFRGQPARPAEFDS
jgi:plasmid stability protein